MLIEEGLLRYILIIRFVFREKCINNLLSNRVDYKITSPIGGMSINWPSNGNISYLSILYKLTWIIRIVKVWLHNMSNKINSMPEIQPTPSRSIFVKMMAVWEKIRRTYLLP